MSTGECAVVLVSGTTVLGHVIATAILRNRGIQWPTYRSVLWAAGWSCTAGTLVGPFAERAHHDFVIHMAGHILLGMLAPVLMVLAAPVTLALRVLPVRAARPLARCINSTPTKVLTQPAIAALLNIGGLWLLYRTGVYAAMRAEPWLHAAVHFHVLAAGFVFTFAVLGGPDPAPHRSHAAWRATTLVVAVAAHNVLAKGVYAAPPDGVSAEQAQVGGQLMYYGSAPVEFLLFVLLCRSWLKPRSATTSHRPDRSDPGIPAGDPPTGDESASRHLTNAAHVRSGLDQALTPRTTTNSSVRWPISMRPRSSR